MIDNRSLPTEAGLSNDVPTGGTRFIWLRVCEYCLSRATTRPNGGARRCQGCHRLVIESAMEDQPPGAEKG